LRREAKIEESQMREALLRLGPSWASSRLELKGTSNARSGLPLMHIHPPLRITVTHPRMQGG
jgi:hypothetical protein